MANAWALFEAIARRAAAFTQPSTEPIDRSHAFDQRNMHPLVEAASKKLFDDGHYAQATFEAYKRLDKEVQKLAKSSESGKSLMMKAFSELAPQIKLTNLSTVSEKDEQEGYKFIFAGSILAIRNPRGHDILVDSLSACLDHLSLASLLFRRLEDIKQ